MIKSHRKKNEGGWNSKKLILKIISNKINNN